MKSQMFADDASTSSTLKINFSSQILSPIKNSLGNQKAV